MVAEPGGCVEEVASLAGETVGGGIASDTEVSNKHARQTKIVFVIIS